MLPTSSLDGRSHLGLSIARFCLRCVRQVAMPQVTVTIHPNGLHPIEAVKAFYKRSAEHMSLDEIVEEGELMSISKKPAGRDAINSAILRVENMSWGDEVIQYICWDANESTIFMALG